MDKEERAFRRMVTEVLVAGPKVLTRGEIHDALGIGKNMVADARKSMEEKTAETPPGSQQKSRLVSRALQRRRKTSKFLEQRNRVRNFFHSKSTPTSRQRDVVKCLVCLFVICLVVVVPDLHGFYELPFMFPQ